MHGGMGVQYAAGEGGMEGGRGCSTQREGAQHAAGGVTLAQRRGTWEGRSQVGLGRVDAGACGVRGVRRACSYVTHKVPNIVIPIH